MNTTKRLAIATLVSILGFWLTILIYELMGPPKSAPIAEPFGTVLGFTAFAMIAITIFGVSLTFRLIRQKES